MKTTRWVLLTTGCLVACSGSNGQSNSSGASSTGGNSSALGSTGNNAGSTSQAGNPPGTGGTEANGSTIATGCPGTSGPSMVKLPQGYCIDSTEVTRDHYAAWLATTPALPASSDANCGWKSTASYAVDAPCMAHSTYVCQGTACGNHPQVCVDWCDAYAYCAGVGKRLCGKIGGGPNAYTDYATASASQWYSACSSNGANTYPYGSTYNATACNGGDYWAPNNNYAILAVGSLTGCQAASAYSGVYDLSGNVDEWEDSCSGTGEGAACRARGGSFLSDSTELACGRDDAKAFAYRGNVYDYLGFRCCAP